MPITTSLDPIDIIRENAELLLLEDNVTNPEFATSEMFEENQVDKKFNTRVFLERALIGNGKVLPVGNVEETYPCKIYFYEMSKLADLQADLEPIYKRMRKLTRKFIARLQNDSRVDKILPYKTIEIAHLLDKDVAGILLDLSFIINTIESVCVT
jgi:hypothetical protein